jgi:hypothetical protein
VKQTFHPSDYPFSSAPLNPSLGHPAAIASVARIKWSDSGNLIQSSKPKTSVRLQIDQKKWDYIPPQANYLFVLGMRSQNPHRRNITDVAGPLLGKCPKPCLNGIHFRSTLEEVPYTGIFDLRLRPLRK